jgi:hypothetical protein
MMGHMLFFEVMEDDTTTTASSASHHGLQVPTRHLGINDPIMQRIILIFRKLYMMGWVEHGEHFWCIIWCIHHYYFYYYQPKHIITVKNPFGGPHPLFLIISNRLMYLIIVVHPNEIWNVSVLESIHKSAVMYKSR